MKTKILFPLAGFIIMVTLFAQDIQPTKGTVIGSRVNVRGRPLATAEICCQLEQGDPVEILEKRLVQTVGTNTEEWLRIVLPEKAYVWLQSNLIDEKKVITTRANGRAGPSLMWPVLCVLSKGESVSVQTNHLDWAGIKPPSHASAWISARYATNAVTITPEIPQKTKK